MKLIELELHGTDRYDYDDVHNSLTWRDIDRLGVPDKLIKTNIPGLVLRMYQYKTAFKIVMVDNGKMVGFVDFVRPKSLLGKRKLTANTYTPHSGIMKSHTGKGHISAVYRWFLDAGHNLITGHEQTEASNSMWRSLARSYKWMLVDKYGYEIENPTEEDGLDPTTRVVLFGKGQSKIMESQYSYKNRLNLISHEVVKAFNMNATVFASSRDANTVICSLAADEARPDDWDEELIVHTFPIFIRRAFEKQFPGEKIELTEPKIEDSIKGTRMLHLKVKLSPHEAG